MWKFIFLSLLLMGLSLPVSANHFGLFFYGGNKVNNDLIFENSKTYRIQRKPSTNLLQIIDTSDSSIYLDNLGTYLSDGDDHEVCSLFNQNVIVPASTTLLLDSSCKWLRWKITGDFTFNGTLTARYLQSAGGTYLAHDFLGNPLSFTINQAQGGWGANSGTYGAPQAFGGPPASGNGGGGAGGPRSGQAAQNGGSASLSAGGTGGNGAGCAIGAAGATNYGQAGFNNTSYTYGVCIAGGGGGFRGSHGQGLIFEIAGAISGSGVLNASGNTGGDGGNTGSNDYIGTCNSGSMAGVGGAGAGGSGGFIYLRYGSNSPTFSLTVAGGSAGSGSWGNGAGCPSSGTNSVGTTPAQNGASGSSNISSM